MQKTITVSIGGLNFQLEEDAYRHLEDYLGGLRRHFGQQADAADILADFESRIAEQLAPRSSEAPVTLAEVSAITARLGKPEDFDAAAPREIPKAPKKLYRNADDALVGGVCSGLAAYFGWDPVWVRIIFVLFTLLNGIGIGIYLVLWIVVPEAKTTAEKLRMQGEPFTVKNVQDTVRQRVEELKRRDPAAAKAKVEAVLRAPFGVLKEVLGGIGRLLRALLRPIGAIIGVAISIGASLGAAGLIFLLVTLLFNVSSPYIDPVVAALPRTAWYYLGLWSAFFVLFVPLVLLLELSSALISGRLRFPKAAAVGLVCLWVVSAGVAASSAFRLAPEIEARVAQDPRLQTTYQEFSVNDFDRLTAGGALRVTVATGRPAGVTVTGPAEAVASLYLNQTANGIEIGRDWKRRFCLFCHGSGELEVQVSVPSLSYLSASGATNVRFDSVQDRDIEIRLSGASRMEAQTSGANQTLHLSGASRLKLSGLSAQLTASLSGASRLDAGNLNAGSAQLELSGASYTDLGELRQLSVNASGASRVLYAGSPVVEKHLSGASHVTAKGAVPKQPGLPELPVETD